MELGVVLSVLCFTLSCSDGQHAFRSSTFRARVSTFFTTNRLQSYEDPYISLTWCASQCIEVGGSCKAISYAKDQDTRLCVLHSRLADTSDSDFTETDGGVYYEFQSGSHGIQQQSETCQVSRTAGISTSFSKGPTKMQTISTTVLTTEQTAMPSTSPTLRKSAEPPITEQNILQKSMTTTDSRTTIPTTVQTTVPMTTPTSVQTTVSTRELTTQPTNAATLEQTPVQTTVLNKLSTTMPTTKVTTMQTEAQGTTPTILQTKKSTMGLTTIATTMQTTMTTSPTTKVMTMQTTLETANPTIVHTTGESTPLATTPTTIKITAPSKIETANLTTVLTSKPTTLQTIIRGLHTTLSPKVSTTKQSTEPTTTNFESTHPAILYEDCYDILQIGGNTESGVYSILLNDSTIIDVYCDMDTDGGGWTVIQRRQDGSVDFYRYWDEYIRGFGDLEGEFWLGNHAIYMLSFQDQVHLRFDLWDFNDTHNAAVYDNFRIGDEAAAFKLSLGTRLQGLEAGDSMAHHNGRKFSTRDQDNDSGRQFCAERFKGGWWYGSCMRANLNGIYLNSPDGPYRTQYAYGLAWFYWHDTHWYSLKFTEMKIRKQTNIPTQ